MRSILIKLIILLAVFGGIAVGIVASSRKNAAGRPGAFAAPATAPTNGTLAAAETTSPTAAAEQKRPRVKVAVLKPESITEHLVLPATVEPWEDIDLSAKVGGTVEWVGPQEGDRVTSGQVIMRLDTDTLQAQVRQAQAQAEQAARQYERMANLNKTGVLARAELDKFLEARKTTQATLEMAQVALANATVRAPIDGVIDRIHADRGEHVDSGRAIAKIVQVDPLKVVVNVPEKDIRYFKEGMTAEVVPSEIQQVPVSIPSEVQAMLDRQNTLRGQIYYVAVTADPNRTFPMYVKVEGAKGALRPGMIVRLKLVRRHAEQAITVPLYAAVDRGNTKVVFVEEDGRARQRLVVPGIIQGSRVQVTYGLAAGERLIVVGQRDLVDGEEIEVEGEMDLSPPGPAIGLEALLPLAKEALP